MHKKISPLPSPKRLRAGRSPLFTLRVRPSLRGRSPSGAEPGPAAEEGCFTSLWYLFPAESRQREVRRDFIEQCRYYYETVYKSEGVNFLVAYSPLKRPDSFPLIIP